MLNQQNRVVWLLLTGLRKNCTFVNSRLGLLQIRIFNADPDPEVYRIRIHPDY